MENKENHPSNMQQNKLEPPETSNKKRSEIESRSHSATFLADNSQRVSRHYRQSPSTATVGYLESDWVGPPHLHPERFAAADSESHWD